MAQAQSTRRGWRSRRWSGSIASMPSQILVAVDFSSVTSAVLTVAADLARASGAPVHLVHVAAPEPEFVGRSVDLRLTVRLGKRRVRGPQVRPRRGSAQHRLHSTPTSDSCVVTARQHFGHGPASKVGGPRVLRVFEQAVGKAFFGR